MPVDKSSERVRRMFGQIAGRYDFLNHLLSLGIDHYWRWRTVRLVPPDGPLPILDVCTGTGDLALAYDRAAGGKTPIVAADFCHEMLAIGRQKAAKAGADGRDHVPRGRRPDRCRCRATRSKLSASRSACAMWPTPTAAWPRWRASLRRAAAWPC